MNKLGKIILSVVVIGGFSMYALYQSQNQSGDFRVAGNAHQTNPAAPITQTQPVATTQPTPTSPETPSTSGAASAPPQKTAGQYTDGTFTGPATDAFYGTVQVQAIIQNGKLANVKFLQYPNDRSTSVQINRQAMPYLIEEALSAQSASVRTVSGASQTSEAFRTSLAAALQSAKS